MGNEFTVYAFLATSAFAMAYKSTIHDTTTNYVFYKNDQHQTIQQPQHV
jgi:hypothetical protein